MIKKNPWKITTMFFAGALAFVAASPGGVQTAEAEAQPRMRVARYSLKKAEAQLQSASHDKGGHRAKALAATRVAIAQVDRAIAFDNQN